MSAQPSPEPIDAEVVDADGRPLEVFEEAIDGEPVPEHPVSPHAPVPISEAALSVVSSPAVQAAAAAATGFVAGAATLAIVRRRDSRRHARAAVRRRATDALPIVGTRSFLIDVHVLRSE